MTRARGRALLWAGTLAVIAYLVWTARGALLPFGIGAVIAYTVLPVVDAVARVIPIHSPRHQVIRRGFAVLFVYLVFGGALFLAAYILVPIVADQVADFVADLPDHVAAARGQIDEWLAMYHERVPEDAQARIDTFAEDLAATAGDALTAAGERSVGILTGTIAIVFGFLVVPFWMFYALRDRYHAGRSLMNAIPNPQRADVANALAIADRLIGRYIRGQLLLGLVVGLAVGIALTVMGVQLSLALGVWAGVTELIPILGPWLGAIPALLLVAGTEPQLLIPVALLFLAVQQLENFLLVPKVQGHAVDIHPGMVILLLVVGGSAFGFLGLVVIVPLAAILRALFWYADSRLSGATPEEAFARSQARRLHRVAVAEGETPPAPAAPEPHGAASPTPSTEESRAAPARSRAPASEPSTSRPGGDGA